MLEFDKKRKLIYGILIGVAIYALVKAGERADSIAALISNWGK